MCRTNEKQKTKSVLDREIFFYLFDWIGKIKFIVNSGTIRYAFQIEKFPIK